MWWLTSSMYMITWIFGKYNLLDYFCITVEKTSLQIISRKKVPSFLQTENIKYVIAFNRRVIVDTCTANRYTWRAIMEYDSMLLVSVITQNPN